MALAAILTRAKSLVEAIPLLAGVPVLVEDKNNLVKMVEETLATQSLALVVGSASGSATAGQSRTVSQADEVIEIVIHRGLLDADTVPSTVQVYDALRPALHGKTILAGGQPGTPAFKFLGQELRELGDGTYARVVRFGAVD